MIQPASQETKDYPMPIDSKELKEKLLQVLNTAVAQDKELRDSLKIGDKFRFIRERLHALKNEVEAAVETIKLVDEGNKRVVEADEQLVYVYIFNARGMDFQSWLKMLHPSVYYEYSVNRPIYGSSEEIESLIRSKSTRVQHGYMEIAVKKTAILSTPETAAKDQQGNSLIKVKEGSLRPERLIHFSHNGIQYFLDEDGHLVKVV